MSNGEYWQRKRKLLNPAFHRQSLFCYLHVFNSNASILADKLEMEVGKPGFDVSKCIELSALDVVIETVTGIKINFQNKENSEICEAFHQLDSAFMKRCIKPWLYPDWLFRLSPSGKETYKNIDKMVKIFTEILEVKRQKKLQRKMKIEVSEDLKSNGIKSEGALLDILMDYSVDGNGFTDKEIVSEITTFIAAGYITTTAAVSFTLYALMKHQDVQEKVVSELNELFGDSNRMPTYNDLSNMKYLETVMKEVFRVYSPVPYIAREVNEDIDLPSGYTIPKGASIFPFFYLLHRSPELYQDPDVFNPDRFNTENSSKQNSYALVPFSAGPRNCIGQKYAMLKVKIFLTFILRKYKVLPPLSGFPDVKLTSQFVLLSKTGINLRIIHRNSS